MPDQIVSIPGVGEVAFPDTMSDANITAAAARLHREAQGGEASHTPNRNASGEVGGSGLAGVGVTAAMKAAGALPAVIHAGARLTPSMGGVVGKAGLAGGAFETGRRAMQGDIQGAAKVAAGTGA